MAITVNSSYIYDSETGTYWPLLAADGVTDDKTKLQATIDACTLTSGVIMLPAGTIQLDTTGASDIQGVAPNIRPAVVMKSDVTLIGSRGTILRATPQAFSGVNYSLMCLQNGAARVFISNVEFDGGYSDAYSEMGFRVCLGGHYNTDVTVADCVFKNSPGKHIFLQGVSGSAYDAATWGTRIYVHDCEFYNLMGNNVSLNRVRDAEVQSCFFHDRYEAGAAESYLSRHDDGVRLKNILQTSQWGEFVQEQNSAGVTARCYQLRNLFISPDGRPGSTLAARMILFGTGASDANSSTVNVSSEGVLSRWTTTGGDGNGFTALSQKTASGGNISAGNIVRGYQTTLDSYNETLEGTDSLRLGSVCHFTGYTLPVGATTQWYAPGSASTYTRHITFGSVIGAPIANRGAKSTFMGNMVWGAAASGETSWCGNALEQDDSTLSSTMFDFASVANGVYCFNVSRQQDATDKNVTQTACTRCHIAFNRIVNTTNNGFIADFSAGTNTSVHYNCCSRSIGAATPTADDLQSNYSAS